MKSRNLIQILVLTILCSLGSLKAQVAEDTPPRDDIYAKVNTEVREPRAYVPLRQADIYFKRRIWRTIDFRQKMNQYLYYPTDPVQDRISFMGLIMQGYKDGTIVAYDPLNDDFRKPLTFEEFTKQNSVSKDIQQEDMNNPGTQITKTVTTEFNPANVKLLSVKEDWFIDKKRAVMDVRILGLAPITQVFDQTTGELRGVRTLFWLYYSDCRPLLATKEVFNRHNSAMRDSYDDVFAWKRFFDSYITKEDNQQDRSINAYTSGNESLYEADRIKTELRNIEDDLWSH